MNESITDFSKLNILVVEDNAVNVFVIKHYLAQWKASVTVAYDGRQAIDEYEKNDYHIILMDLYMSVMDGFEASKNILELNPSAKIIAITATQEDDILERIKEAGIVDVICKPFQPDELSGKIKKALNL